MKIAVVGAGPAGLALALLASRWLPAATIRVYDARPPTQDPAADPRTLALALGSVQLLQQLGAYPAAQAQPIRHVHVSQAAPGDQRAVVQLDAAEEGVALLGAVLPYGALVAALQQAFAADAAREPQRLALQLGTAVAALQPAAGGVQLAGAGDERYDLAVVAEGGVFGEQPRRALARDYAQTAWVGTAWLEGAPAATAFERFTHDGPLALLPLPPRDDDPPAQRRAALVWCVARDDDPVRALDAAQRVALAQGLLPAAAGRLVALSPLASFALGLNAEPRLVQQRCVRIGNAAQTLHPVAGQGFNLALRDVHELVLQLRDGSDLDAALRRFDRARRADRFGTLAITDLLARGFTWRAPLAAPLRAAALAALQAATPLKSMLARQMMFGRR